MTGSEFLAWCGTSIPEMPLWVQSVTTRLCKQTPNLKQNKNNIPAQILISAFIQYNQHKS